MRDGDVYHQALEQSRAALDRYVKSLDVAPSDLERWSRDDRLAFWLNAYHAFVLRTVVDHYPIRGRAPAYPPLERQFLEQNRFVVRYLDCDWTLNDLTGGR